MYRYKFLTNCGVTLAFESKFHIAKLTPVIFPDATFVHFEDAEMVIKLTEIEEIEINGFKHQVKSYQV